MERVKKIVVLRLGAMGDILFTTPALRGLKAKYPGCHITYIALEKWRFVLERNPSVDRFFGLQYCHPKAVAKLADEEFDLLVNFYGAADGTQICQSLRAKQRRGNQWLNDELVSDENSKYLKSVPHMAREGITYPDLFCRIAGVLSNDLHYDFFPSWLDHLRAAFYWRLNGLYRVIALHLDSRGALSKQWGAESVRQVAQLMPEQRFLVLGYAKDQALTQPLEDVPNIKVNYYNVCAQAELIRRCCLFVGIDSGPRQIASAMRVPVLCLFGPRPATVLPVFEKDIALNVDCPKSPCFETVCPEGRNCMSQIPPQVIVHEIRRMLDSTATTSH